MLRRMPGKPPPQVDFWESHDLDDHVALIKRQVDRSLRDPETRRLAVKIASSKPDYVARDGTPLVRAWDGEYVIKEQPPCAMKDGKCEIAAIWNFGVLNVRYVLDPDGFDLFCTVRETLEAGGGDCDDTTVLYGALLRALGFRMRARIVSVSGTHWEHVYPVVGFPKERPTQWLPLDATVQGAVPGWEYEGIVRYQDFKL